MKVIIQQTVEYFMTLKISRSQVSTQPNPPKIKKSDPTQPMNPWMDPTHDQLWLHVRKMLRLIELWDGESFCLTIPIILQRGCSHRTHRTW